MRTGVQYGPRVANSLNAVIDVLFWQEPNMTVSNDNQSHEPLNVLCVDDNQDAADTLGEMLSIVGHNAAICHDWRFRARSGGERL